MAVNVLRFYVSFFVEVELVSNFGDGASPLNRLFGLLKEMAEGDRKIGIPALDDLASEIRMGAAREWRYNIGLMSNRTRELPNQRLGEIPSPDVTPKTKQKNKKRSIPNSAKSSRRIGSVYWLWSTAAEFSQHRPSSSIPSLMRHQTSGLSKS